MGDRDEEFAEYAAARWRMLLHAAMLLGASLPEAEDLTQTTLMKAYAAWGRVSRADNRDAYVSRMLLNGFRSSRRRRWWGERPSGELPDGEVPDATAAVDDADLVRGALDRLTSAQREVVVLRYFAHLSEAETGEALGVPLGTVKSRVARALARLSADPQLAELFDTDGSTP